MLFLYIIYDQPPLYDTFRAFYAIIEEGIPWWGIYKYSVCCPLLGYLGRCTNHIRKYKAYMYKKRMTHRKIHTIWLQLIIIMIAKLTALRTK